MYFVQETDKPKAISYFFNIVKLEENKIILPIAEDCKISNKKAEKLAEKTKKILDKSNSNKLIISKNIKKQECYQNCLYSYNTKIVDGKWLFQVLSAKAVEYVVEKKKLKKEEIAVSILINDATEILIENIKKIIREYKKVNIITNHIEKFKKIEEKTLEEEGIMITINNNKRKSLAKSEIILNADFPTELINRYIINDEAVIINLRQNVKINKKRFNGININNYKIAFNNLEEFDEINKNLYEEKDIYEGHICHKQPFDSIERKLKQDGVKIVELIGAKTIL